MKLSRRALWIAGGLAAGLVLGAGYLTFAQRGFTWGWGPGWGMGMGMHWGWGPGNSGYYQYNSPDRPQDELTPAEISQIVTEFLADSGSGTLDGTKLALDHVMNFETGYYAAVKESDTGRGAMELIVDPYTGQVFPEPGPNMMWNEAYSPMGGWAFSRVNRRPGWGPWGGGCHGPGTGMMGGYWPGYDATGDGQSDDGRTNSTVTRLTEDEAAAQAQKFLDAEFPGAKAVEPIHFYGYYTFDIVKDGQVQGMLSVHDVAGEVWYHAWHGRFLGEDHSPVETTQES